MIKKAREIASRMDRERTYADKVAVLAIALEEVADRGRNEQLKGKKWTPYGASGTLKWYEEAIESATAWEAEHCEPVILLRKRVFDCVCNGLKLSDSEQTSLGDPYSFTLPFATPLYTRMKCVEGFLDLAVQSVMQSRGGYSLFDLRFLEPVTGSVVVKQVPYLGLLKEIDDVSRGVASGFGSVEEAVSFVLTGWRPPIPVAEMCFERGLPPSVSRIHLRLDPRLKVEEVASIYREAVDVVVGESKRARRATDESLRRWSRYVNRNDGASGALRRSVAGATFLEFASKGGTVGRRALNSDLAVLSGPQYRDFPNENALRVDRAIATQARMVTAIDSILKPMGHSHAKLVSLSRENLFHSGGVWDKVSLKFYCWDRSEQVSGALRLALDSDDEASFRGEVAKVPVLQVLAAEYEDDWKRAAACFLDAYAGASAKVEPELKLAWAELSRLLGESMGVKEK